MALGRQCSFRTGSFGRKRVVVSNEMDIDSTVNTPKKKHCVEGSDCHPQKSLLEALPQELLVRILCGVDHSDLKGLFHVSKLIRELTLYVKHTHFEYSTPKKSLSLRTSFDSDGSGEFLELETPGAPRQLRAPRSRLCEKQLADISVALFASKDDEEAWPRKNLLLEFDV